jgi:hypothetical protein
MNLYRQLLNLIPLGQVDVGEVTAVSSDGVFMLLQSGHTLRVRGTGTVGENYYIKNGVIEGQAPNLSGTDIEI